MHDPLEGVTATGTIRTGAARARVPAVYWPVLDAAVALVSASHPPASAYVYGSVATGQARLPASDVDLLTIDLPAARAREISAVLSSQFGHLCRGVEIGAATMDDFSGDGDEAYGGRVFLHHYCVNLAGPNRDVANADFPADDRAARGFNGDIARHARRWHEAVADTSPEGLGRRIGRKTLLAVAGLVSVHDQTWTTDREHAARRWSDIEPPRAEGLAQLLAWSEGRWAPSREQVVDGLDTVDSIVATFAESIGLWDAQCF